MTEDARGCVGLGGGDTDDMGHGISWVMTMIVVVVAQVCMSELQTVTRPSFRFLMSAVCQTVRKKWDCGH